MSQSIHPADDTRTVDELVNLALADVDGEGAWYFVVALHCRGTREVFDCASGLSRSPSSRERQLAADILGQLGMPDRTFPDDCCRVLLGMLGNEEEPKVLRAIFVGLSYLHDAKVIPAAETYARHPDAEVRQGIVLALTGCDELRAINLLIQFASDDSVYVRDWATFALGSQTDLDTPEIRDALAARLDDGDADTRGEALVGLAGRKDTRVVAALRQELASGNVGTLAVEAAELIRSPELYPELVALRDWWDVDSALLERAIAACGLG